MQSRPEKRRIETAADFLRSKLKSAPDAAVILGSGLGDIDFGPTSVHLAGSDVPDYPESRVAGHPGTLSLAGSLLVLRGRVHAYEGRSLEEVVRPVRILARLGVKTLAVTNAAGAIRAGFRPGDLMLITDHLNLMGADPWRGSARFTDLTSAYDPELIRRAGAAARKQRLRLHQGVYAAVAGPSYETPAEVRMLRKLGADAVGMSTVPEVIAARGEGLKVLGLSVLANPAAGISRRPVAHDEVLEVVRGAAARAGRLLSVVFGAGKGPG